MYPHCEIKRCWVKILPSCLSSSHETQTNTRARGRGTACAAYHGALRTAVLEAAGFFVEAVVGSRGFGHLLHDRLGFHVLLCSRVYRDVSSLKQARKKVHLNTSRYRFRLACACTTQEFVYMRCLLVWYEWQQSNNACSVLYSILSPAQRQTCNLTHK